MADKGILEAWSCAVGEQLNKLAGLRFTRLTANVAVGVTTWPVESTHGWPASGKVLCRGVTYTYASKTMTSLIGVRWSDQTNDDPVTGTLNALDEAVTVPLVGPSVVHVELSGTWAGNIKLEQSADGVTWVIVASFGAGAHDTEEVVTGALARLRMHTYTSGAAVAALEVIARSGARQALKVATEVIEASRTYSALDQLRRQLFVRTAEGPYLSALGRKLGIDRPANLTDDDVFRLIIQAMAYSPRGTIYGIELALTAFFGEGNFRIYEDFPTYPCTVFIEMLGGVTFSATVRGRAILMVHELRPLNTGTKEVTVADAPEAVQGVRLADEGRSDTFAAPTKPSGLTEVRYTGDAGIPLWTFVGDFETDVTMHATEGAKFANIVGRTTAYFRPTRIIGASRARFSVQMAVRSALSTDVGSGLQWCTSLLDGNVFAVAGCIGTDATHYDVGFVSALSGQFIDGGAVNLENDTLHDVEIRKDGANFELWVDGVFRQYATSGDFIGGAASELNFGAQDSAYAADVDVRHAAFWAETSTDFWNIQGAAGSTATTSPTRFATGAAVVQVGDVGKAFRTLGTGRNTGNWIVESRITSGLVTLTAPERRHAFVEGGNPSRVSIANVPDAFTYPQDRGKKLQLLSDDVDSDNDGLYLIAELLDPVTGAVLTGTLVSQTNLCQVSAISPSVPPPFTSETGLRWKLLPNFTTEVGTVEWELVEVGTVVGAVLTLRENPVIDLGGGTVIVEATYALEHSAHALPDTETKNDPVDTWYPFYLPGDPLGPFSRFMDDLTVAGVFAEVIEE